MTRKNYTHDERVAALAALAANANNKSKTARVLGIPMTTLSQWANGTRHPEASQTADASKEGLRDLLERAARALVGVALEKMDEMGPKDAMIAAAVAIDKMQLLAGRPTQINQHDLVNKTDEELRRELEEVRAARGLTARALEFDSTDRNGG